MTIEVHSLPTGIWVVRPHGRIDVPAARALEEALNELLETGQAWIIVDFEAVMYITSAGLKTVLSGMRRARKLGGDLHLSAMAPRVTEIFAMAGFDQVFTIHATTAEAAERLRPA